MAGEVVNSNFGLLNKFGASRQEIASKTATSHMRKTLAAIFKEHKMNKIHKININQKSCYYENN